MWYNPRMAIVATNAMPHCCECGRLRPVHTQPVLIPTEHNRNLTARRNTQPHPHSRVLRHTTAAQYIATPQRYNRQHRPNDTQPDRFVTKPYPNLTEPHLSDTLSGHALPTPCGAMPHRYQTRLHKTKHHYTSTEHNETSPTQNVTQPSKTTLHPYDWRQLIRELSPVPASPLPQALELPKTQPLTQHLLADHLVGQDDHLALD